MRATARATEWRMKQHMEKHETDGSLLWRELGIKVLLLPCDGVLGSIGMTLGLSARSR